MALRRPWRAPLGARRRHRRLPERYEVLPRHGEARRRQARRHDLPPMRLPRCRPPRASPRGASLTQCSFLRANLEGIDLRGCGLHRRQLRRRRPHRGQPRRLLRANFRRGSIAEPPGVQAKAAFFGEASLRGAKLAKAMLRYATFTGGRPRARQPRQAPTCATPSWPRPARGAPSSGRARVTAISPTPTSRAPTSPTPTCRWPTCTPLRDEDAVWTGASLPGARRTDADRLEAEGWTPPTTPGPVTGKEETMIDAAVRDHAPRGRAARSTSGPAEVRRGAPRRSSSRCPTGRPRAPSSPSRCPTRRPWATCSWSSAAAAEHYVIGVLHGAGRTALRSRATSSSARVNGKLSLSATTASTSAGPRSTSTRRALRMVARDVTQKFESLCQRVSALLRVHAGESPDDRRRGRVHAGEARRHPHGGDGDHQRQQVHLG